MNNIETLTGQGFESRSFNNNNTIPPKTVDQAGNNNNFGGGIIGLEAITLHLSVLNVPSNELWFKVSHNQIYVAVRADSEVFTIDTPIYETVDKGDDRRKGKSVGKLGEFLLNKSLSEDGGIFYNPGFPQGGFTKKFLIGATDIGFETDDLPLEVANTLYDEFESVTGLKITRLSSGGKSVHGHITSQEVLTQEKGLYLRRLAAIAFFGDPCIGNNLCQPMRFAGPYRKEKGKYQSLYQVGGKYTYQEILKGFRKYYTHKGLPFPESIPTDSKWYNERFAPILKTSEKKASKKNKDGSLNVEAFNRDSELIKKELELGLENFENEKRAKAEERQKRAETYRQKYDSINGGTSLIDYVIQANDRLGDNAFSVEKEGKRNGYFERCDCPFHQSASGNSAMIIEKGGQYTFWCRQCTPNRIDGFFFNYCLDNGLEPIYSNYPKRKEFSEYAKTYCDHAGVTIPKNEGRRADNISEDEGFDIENFKQEKKRKYEELQKFTPDIIIKDRISNYSPTELKNILLENGVKLSGEGMLDGITLHVKAPTGAGKTQQLIATLKEFYWTVGVGLLGYRNGLLEQTKERADNAFVHIHYDKKEFNDLDNSLWLSTCVNSILKVDIDWWKGKIIVLDEIVAILEYLAFSKTLEHNRAEIIERFIYALKVSRGVICLDGHNADFIGNFFTGLTDKPVVKLLNDYAIPRPDIKFLEGTIKNQKLKKNDKSPFLKHIKETIAHNPISVTSDSKIFLKSLTEILESLGYKCLLITSETKSKKAVKDFIANPDKALLENKYDAILYSPSAESGLSIDTEDYFKAFYAFFFGVLGTNAQQQMIIRVRDIECPRYVWLRSHSIVTDSTFERRFDDVALLRSLLTSEVNQLTLENPDQILATITEKIENFPHQLRGLAENFRLIAQYERINFREAFCNAVTENGYPLERVILESDKQSKQELKAKTNAVKDRESAEIFNASDKFLYSTLPILGENATDADRAALKKAKILTDLPNLEYEDLWSPEFVRFLEFDRVMTLSHRRRYVMAHNLELAQKISNRRYQRYTQKNGLCPWDLKTEYLQSKAIAESGILELITFLINNPSASLTADHPMVKGIIQKCKKATIYKALGRSPGQQPMRFISWLLNLLGYRLKEHNYKTPDGKKHREYLLNYDDLVETSPYFEVIDRLLTIRFEHAVLAPESSTIPENSLENESLKNDYVDTPQSYTEHGVESVPDSSDKIEKSEDHLEPIQEPITVESSTTTSTNQHFKVGDRVAYLKFGELKSATIQSLKDVSDMGAKLSASVAVLDDGVSISVRNLQAIA